MLNTDNLTLREETYPVLTTKGAELTNQELDENFINIRKDIVNLSTAPNLPNYNPVTEYSQFNVVTYNDKIYRFISVTPQDGIEPGSDVLVWEEINLNELAHQHNSDTKLAEGTVDEVSANEIRDFIDAGSGGGPTIYTANGTVASYRIIDANGNDISFINGGVFIFASSFAPTGVNGSHTIEGYGTLSTDIVQKVSSDLGVIHEMYGDLSQKAFGTFSMVGVNPIYFGGTTQGMNKNSSANAVSIFKAGAGNWTFGWNFMEMRGFGTFASNSIEVNNDNSESYFTQIDSNNGKTWKFGHKTGNGSIAGKIGGGLVDTEIIIINQITGKSVFNLGHINITPLTTTQINALTSSEGDLAYNSTLGALCFKDATGWRKVSHSAM